MEKKAIVAGAGPAGLTAAYELLDKTGIRTTVLEETGQIGGISQTVNYKGNRMDIGGHRFFSKNDEVMAWWRRIMPLQGKPALDDVLLNKTGKEYAPGGPNPAEENRVMLIRERVSRIFYLRKFFDYPISLKWQTFANMGLARTFRAGFGFLRASLCKRPETSLENFYINRFGKPLYKMFFEDYTQKVWGIHPSELGADWGSQRVKGLSVAAILKDVLSKPFRKKNLDQKKVETSLIEQFIYPKFGPGQLWETVAEEVKAKGGQVLLQNKVCGVCVENNRVVAVEVEENGQLKRMDCDYFISSMPLRDLVAAIKGVDIPEDVRSIAAALPYRDFITVGVLVKKLKIENQTKIKTYQKRIPDTWIYVQERDVKVGRLQIFNNWSPYMVEDYENTLFIGMEYFCTEGDELWNMEEKDFIRMAVDELEKIHVLDKQDVLDATRIKIKKAYPSYYGSYYRLDKVKTWLDQIENLYCIGRNGQHRYNNMDHSMLTAMETVKNIAKGKTGKENIWAVNTEEEYHETKKR